MGRSIRSTLSILSHTASMEASPSPRSRHRPFVTFPHAGAKLFFCFDPLAPRCTISPLPLATVAKVDPPRSTSTPARPPTGAGGRVSGCGAQCEDQPRGLRVLGVHALSPCPERRDTRRHATSRVPCGRELLSPRGRRENRGGVVDVRRADELQLKWWWRTEPKDVW